MKERITVLMGAGAMMEYTKVSTSSLTKKIIDSCQQYKACKYFRSYAEQCEYKQCYYNYRYQKSVVEFLKDLYKDQTGGDANFEMIFHMLEMIYNYQGSLKDSPNAEKIEKVIVGLNSDLSGINFSSIYYSLYKILDVINDEIYGYDSEFAKKGTTFKTFFEKLLESGQYCLDVFNLNYDTWVEQSISEYVDGFDDDMDKGIKRFNSKKYLEECDQNRISHLHGQIYFGFHDSYKKNYADTQDMLYKYENYEAGKENRERVIHGQDTNQAGRRIIYSNIITGLLKTDKVLWHPMDVYHSMLVRSLIQNRRLIIIGYGFADAYINKALSLHNNANVNDKKIIMIDKKEDNDGESAYSSNPFKSNDGQKVYLDRVFQRSDWFKCKEFKQKTQDAHFLAKDKGVCVYGNGFNKVIRENMDEILEFLQ